jgi:subtilisin-like proprotein convertase family protein
MLRKTMGAALAIALLGVGTASAAEKTFTAGGLPKDFTDEGTITKKLKIKPKGKIKDVNVHFGVQIGSNDSVTALLRHPSGTAIHLTSGNGGDANGYSAGTIFDDEAEDEVQNYEGVDHVFSGPYKPEEHEDFFDEGGLRRLDGKKLQGTWELIVIDTNEFGSGGTLSQFKVQAKYKPA